MYFVIGGNSEIGAASTRHLEERGHAVVTSTRRSGDQSEGRIAFDIERPISDLVLPDGVVAACIFIAVARLAACAGDPAASARINCDQTIALVDHLTERGIYTLFPSTNQVFDGSNPHVAPDAPTAPVSEYGRQKARTEAALRERMDRGSPIGILRLAKVVSPGMALIEGWKRELSAGRPVRAFADVTMAPTPTPLVAEAIARLLEDRAVVTAQLTGPRDAAYSDVARLIARDVGATDSLVELGRAAEAGMPEGATPRHTTLDSGYLRERYCIVAPDVDAVVREALAKP